MFASRSGPLSLQKPSLIYNFQTFCKAVPDEEAAFNFARSWGLIPYALKCDRCNEYMDVVRRQQREGSNTMDAGGHTQYRYSYECQKRACKRHKKAVTTDTVFASSRLSMRQVLLLLLAFANNYRKDQARLEVAQHGWNVKQTEQGPEWEAVMRTLNIKTVTDYYKKFQDQLVAYIRRDRLLVPLGGDRGVVEIDEG